MIMLKKCHYIDTKIINTHIRIRIFFSKSFCSWIPGNSIQATVESNVNTGLSFAGTRDMVRDMDCPLQNPVNITYRAMYLNSSYSHLFPCRAIRRSYRRFKARAGKSAGTSGAIRAYSSSVDEQL